MRREPCEVSQRAALPVVSTRSQLLDEIAVEIAVWRSHRDDGYPVSQQNRKYPTAGRVACFIVCGLPWAAARGIVMRKVGGNSGSSKWSNASGSSLGSLRTAWYAVSVAPGRPHCKAVEFFVGERWLSAQAPRFPVSGCDASHCDCRYRHHDDRRGKPRRQIDGGTSLPRPWTHSDRRAQNRGRRKSDLLELDSDAR